MIEANKISEPIRVRFDNKGIPDGFIIPCQFFRESGKWYMDENVVIPLNTPTFGIKNAIKNNRRTHTFITTGISLIGVPFLVSAGE